MNRLFGKSKKQLTNQVQEQPGSSFEEASGFVVIASPEQRAVISPANSSTNPYGYSTPGVANLPYAIGSNQAPAITKPPVHYLEGVPFNLPSGTGENNLDAILARAEAASERLKSIMSIALEIMSIRKALGAYEYDFCLENSVIEQGTTVTNRHGTNMQDEKAGKEKDMCEGKVSDMYSCNKPSKT